MGCGDAAVLGSERGEGVGRGAVSGVGCGDAVGVASVGVPRVAAGLAGAGDVTVRAGSAVPEGVIIRRGGAGVCVGTGVTSRTIVARGIGVDVTNWSANSRRALSSPQAMVSSAAVDATTLAQNLGVGDVMLVSLSKSSRRNPAYGRVRQARV
jgi:hypothetical protein